MSGVTHGADADRLRGIAEALRGNGAQIEKIGEKLGPAAQALEASWSGPDAEGLAADVAQVRPAIASIGSTIIAWADELRAQADEQTQGSGGGARGGSGGASTRPDRQDAIDKIKDVTSKLTSGDGRRSGMHNPLLAALDKPRGGHDAPPDAEPRNIIDGRPGGREEGTGSVSQSESKGKHVKVSGTVTASTTDAGVDDKGRGLQTHTVAGTAELSAEASAKVGRVGVDGKLFAGTETSWSVTGPDGLDPMSIHPLDPLGMPEGSSIRLGSSWYTGNELGGEYSALMASMGKESGIDRYVEVSRGEGDEVTVRVGDADFDKAKSSVGLGVDKANVGLSADSSFTEGTAKDVTFDLSTAEGQDAYTRFLILGKVPSADAAGVTDIADVEAFSGSRSTGSSLTLGGKTFGSDGSSWEAGGLTKHHADGRETVEWSSDSGRTQAGGTTVYDADGTKDRDASSYYLRQRDVEPVVARQYNQYQGSDVEPSQRQNVAISLTSTDLQAMRYQAAEVAAEKINDGAWYRGSDDIDTSRHWTANDVLDFVEGDPAKASSLDGLDTSSTKLLAAQSDDDMIDAMVEEGPVEFQNELAAEYDVWTGRKPGHRGTVTSTGTGGD
ncbi:hypothetical protein [Janibacter hoylei]|uniref:hypothetical protein n=1 Tax=Janibacter hoylei TaxID=364298 RepID=UPI002492325F|nr:hypothetical protein [Janibacter hoylei]